MNDLTNIQSFQERVGSMIRSQIGDLMTDAELKALVDRAMDQAFFTERTVGDSWNRKTEPPYAVAIVTELLREEVATAARAWVASNPDKVQQAIRDAIGKGSADMLVHGINAYLFSAFEAFRNELRNKGFQV